jgi:U3 small nucleolar RNA-associated protein 3
VLPCETIKKMGRKKRGNKNPLTQKSEEDFEGASSINAIHRWEDIGGDSEDEFHEQREKILLDGSPSSNDESEHEIMALEGDSDEELARLENLAQKLKPELYKKGVKSDSDSEEAQEQGNFYNLIIEMDESWGKSRKVYYEGEDINADEEAAKEEEKEALKIQKKRAQTMKEQDFMDEAFDETLMEKYHLHKTPTGMESAQDLSLADQTSFDISEIQKMSDSQLKDLLQNAMPDVIGLTDEFLEKWEYLQETLGPALNWSLDAIQVSDPDELTPIVFCQLKYRK